MQLAERVPELAMSGFGQVVEAMQHVCGVVEAAYTEVTLTHSQVASRMEALVE